MVGEKVKALTSQDPESRLSFQPSSINENKNIPANQDDSSTKKLLLPETAAVVEAPKPFDMGVP